MEFVVKFTRIYEISEEEVREVAELTEGMSKEEELEELKRAAEEIAIDLFNEDKDWIDDVVNCFTYEVEVFKD